MSEPPTVLYEADQGLAIVTLNRPASRNGLAGDMLERLFGILTKIAADPEIAVVILRGAGGDFCVGADIKAIPDGVSGKTDFRKVARLYHVSTLLHEMPQVTIAAIDGGCAGAGLGWAAACDFRFASDRAVFSTAFLKVGVAGDMGTGWSLCQAVGPAMARELMFFPEKLGPERAMAIGLVTRVFPAAELHGRTERLARELTSRPRLALEMIKQNFLSAERAGLKEYIEIEGARHSHVVVSEGATEGFRAFIRASRSSAPA